MARSTRRVEEVMAGKSDLTLKIPFSTNANKIFNNFRHSELEEDY